MTHFIINKKKTFKHRKNDKCQLFKVYWYCPGVSGTVMGCPMVSWGVLWCPVVIRRTRRLITHDVNATRFDPDFFNSIIGKDVNTVIWNKKGQSEILHKRTSSDLNSLLVKRQIDNPSPDQFFDDRSL